jgi:hypothetical protein
VIQDTTRGSIAKGLLVLLAAEEAGGPEDIE